MAHCVLGKLTYRIAPRRTPKLGQLPEPAMSTLSPGVGVCHSGTLAEIFTAGDLGLHTWEESALMECSGV